MKILIAEDEEDIAILYKLARSEFIDLGRIAVLIRCLAIANVISDPSDDIYLICCYGNY